MRKPIELSNNIQLFCKSMGKVFRVFEICNTAEEANDYCTKHKDAAIIAEDKLGRIYIACQYSSICKSDSIL